MAQAGVDPSPPKNAPGAHTAIRFLTWNLHFRGRGPAKVVRHLKQRDPDVIALQEMTPAWWLRLRRELSATHPHAVVLRHPIKGGWLAAFSRYPLEKVAAEERIDGWVPSWVLRVKTPLGPVQMVNVHLWVPADEAGRPSPFAMWRARTHHVDELRGLFSHVDNKEPVVVLGDFNETPLGAGRAWLLERDFKDALEEKGSQAPTWTNENQSIPLWARIDHLLISSHFSVRASGVDDVDASDHRPVWADVALEAPGG
jgi:endonuclease/exonuclease/phosphatase (EEP) superfamily protein YafD